MKLFHWIIKFLLNIFFEEDGHLGKYVVPVEVVIDTPLIYHEVNTRVIKKNKRSVTLEPKRQVEQNDMTWREFKRYNATVNHYLIKKEVIP